MLWSYTVTILPGEFQYLFWEGMRTCNNLMVLKALLLRCRVWCWTGGSTFPKDKARWLLLAKSWEILWLSLFTGLIFRLFLVVLSFISLSFWTHTPFYCLVMIIAKPWCMSCTSSVGRDKKKIHSLSVISQLLAIARHFHSIAYILRRYFYLFKFNMICYVCQICGPSIMLKATFFHLAHRKVRVS